MRLVVKVQSNKPTFFQYLVSTGSVDVSKVNSYALNERFFPWAGVDSWAAGQSQWLIPPFSAPGEAISNYKSVFLMFVPRFNFLTNSKVNLL